MSTEYHTERRHQYGDDDRRGHPLQHRDRDEGWAEMGTWTHLHDDPEGSTGAREGGNDRTEGQARRHASTRGAGQSPQERDRRRTPPDRSYGDGPATADYRSRGNPRTGSQRGSDSELSPTGRVGGQFGDLHGSRRSAAESAGYHEDDQVGGRRGRSARDAAFGSRRGTGLGRRRDPRVENGR